MTVNMNTLMEVLDRKRSELFPDGNVCLSDVYLKCHGTLPENTLCMTNAEREIMTFERCIFHASIPVVGKHSMVKNVRVMMDGDDRWKISMDVDRSAWCFEMEVVGASHHEWNNSRYIESDGYFHVISVIKDGSVIGGDIDLKPVCDGHFDDANYECHVLLGQCMSGFIMG